MLLSPLAYYFIPTNWYIFFFFITEALKALKKQMNKKNKAKFNASTTEGK
jgi:hypothetical protein